MIFRRFLFIGSFLLTSQIAEANLSCEFIFSDKPTIEYRNRNILLFENGTFSKDYFKIAKNIEAGDWFQLPSGRTVQVHEILGHGQLTKVLDIGDGWVLRIPIAENEVYTKDSIKGFIKLQKELKSEGIRVVDIDHSRSEPPYAIFVRKENFRFKGDQFFHYQKNGWPDSFTPELIQLAEKKFKQFMLKTWRYIDISDVTPRQMGFNGTEWVLFDFYGYGSPSHMPLRNFKEKKIIMHASKFENPFGGENAEYQLMPKRTEKDLEDKINSIREKMLENDDWYERSEIRSSISTELIDRVTVHPLPNGWTRDLNSSSDSWFERDAHGYAPKANKISIEIKEFIKIKDNVAIYKAVVNKKFNVKLRLIINNKKDKGYDQLRHFVKKARNDGDYFLSGADFILYFDNKQGDELRKISE